VSSRGADLTLSARDAQVLYSALRVEEVRLQVRGRSEQLDAALWEWRTVALREHQRAISAVSSLIGTAIDEDFDDDASSPVMSTAQVAARANVTTRAVRRAAAEGRLAGRRVGPRMWLFDSAAVTKWIRERRTA
jgi:excisionase family DNA binding protein